MRHGILYFLAGKITIFLFILATPVPGSAVDILIRKSEAESMKLGSPGQTIVVQDPPAIKATTAACDGKSGSYPVQSVLVFDGDTTYISSIIVCSPDGLRPGDTVTPAVVGGDHPTEGDLEYARYEGILVPSAPAVPAHRTRAGVTQAQQPGVERGRETAQGSSGQEKARGARDFAAAAEARPEKPPLGVAGAPLSLTERQGPQAWRPWRLGLLVLILVLIPSAFLAIRKRTWFKGR
ncbi:MAG: hypothetical protein HY694_01895 [Deltaproteobacteria bacterium]|nr:hypothetical protein [Deltaproteobacteria bacterium]